MTRTGSRLGRLLHYFALVLLALTAVALLAGLVGLAVTLVAPGLWPADATIRGAGQAAVPLSDNGDRALACLFVVLSATLAAAVLVPLIGLMRSAAAGAPFVAANVRRLRIIAGAFAAFAAARVLVPLVAAPRTEAMFGMEGPTVDLGPILMALVVLVLAEVFREGVRLREDAEGTI